MCSGVCERRHAGRDVLGQPDLGAGARPGADRLHGEPVAEHDVVTRLVQFARRQFEAGRVDAPAIAEIQETPGFVEREDVFHPVADALGDIAGIVARTPLTVSLDCQPPTRSCSACGRSQ